MNTEVEYLVSVKLSQFQGYQSKNGARGTVKAFVGNIWNHTTGFDDFVRVMQAVLLLERICLERSFQKVKVKARCKPFVRNKIQVGCKMQYIAIAMLYMQSVNEKLNQPQGETHAGTPSSPAQ